MQIATRSAIVRPKIVFAAVGILLVLFAGRILLRDKRATNEYPNFRVQFIDQRTGWIIGLRLFRTIDGGHTWSIITYSHDEDVIKAKDGPEYAKYAIQFVDAIRGWRLSLIDSSALEYTEDGGESWKGQTKVGGFGRSLIFSSLEDGWVLGNRTFATHDSGHTWRQEEELDGLNLRFPYFLDKDHGWLANEWGVIVRTSDGGKHWNLIRTSLRDVRTIFFVTATDGWAVGDDGLIAKTKNGGSAWTTVQSAVIPNTSRNMRTTLLDVFFQTPTIGWIAGYDGIILSTTDGGETWHRVSTPTHAPLSSIRFIDDSHGWAVGGYAEPAMPVGKPSNVVIETDDGGKTWHSKTFQ